MASTAKASALAETWIAILGRRDGVADGVEDYCTFLGQALAWQGTELRQARVHWADAGWWRALKQLWRESSDWRGAWVLIQYTAMAWSRRGFPLGALVTLGVLRHRGVRCAVVFHESCGVAGPRAIDRIRAAFQNWVVCSLYKATTRSVFTVPVETIGWLPKGEAKAAFIPIGANIPERQARNKNSGNGNGGAATIAAFCLSPGPNRFLEVADMAYAARCVFEAVGKAHLVVLGKGSDDMRTEIEGALAGSGVGVSVLGMMPAEEVSETLSKASALLFVCGFVSQKRGSALAGIACGLPIIGYSGGVAGTPMEEAGVVLVPYRNQKALGAALARVMADEKLQAELRDKSRRAQEKYFSWGAIAKRYTRIFRSKPSDAESAR